MDERGLRGVGRLRWGFGGLPPSAAVLPQWVGKARLWDAAIRGDRGDVPPGAAWHGRKLRLGKEAGEDYSGLRFCLCKNSMPPGSLLPRAGRVFRCTPPWTFQAEIFVLRLAASHLCVADALGHVTSAKGCKPVLITAAKYLLTGLQRATVTSAYRPLADPNCGRRAAGHALPT